MKNESLQNIKGIKSIMIFSSIMCLIFYILTQMITLPYITSTFSKIILFGVFTFAFYYKQTKKSPFSLIIEKKDTSNLKISIIIGIIVVLIVWVSYIIFDSLINLNLISQELSSMSNITPKTYPFVAAYITIGNSFLEEVFFRGFIFLQIYKKGYKKTAHIFSAGLFAIYHVAIFQTWFNPIIIVLSLLGLFIGGLIFNFINIKPKSVFNSWIIHACANISIVSIGFIMYGFI